MPDIMQQRKDEILAKKAKLVEMRRRREERSRDFSSSRQSIGDASEIVSPAPGRADNRRDLEMLISTLVSRDSSSGPHTGAKGSRPNSVLSAEGLSGDTSDVASPAATQSVPQSHSPMIQPTAQQHLETAPLSTVYEYAPSSTQDVLTYSKGVQTSDAQTSQQRRDGEKSLSSDEDDTSTTSVNNKRLSRRERERHEELRENIRREIEEELRELRDPKASLGAGNPLGVNQPKFPARILTTEELNAVTSSNDFLDFVDRSSKVIERALDQEYDILADYSLGGVRGAGDDDDDERVGPRGKGKRQLKEVAQFWDERWSRKRMISGVRFSPKFPELLLASYTKNPTAPHDPDGLVQVWNLHLHDRPEYVFHAQSDVLVAKFSPFHPNLIVGGAYSGQVLLWDTRAKSAPVQKTPLTGAGHTHPVYSVDIVGTQNANNIISCSTDGVVCGWTVDMLSQPQEFLELMTPPPAKTEDLSPTCTAFPQADPTYFLAGTEEGSIYACHRYDRAGAKAGVEQRIAYRGHAAPVMSLDFHPARGAVDLGDLVLSSSLDWSVKLWKVRAPAATSESSVPGSSLQTVKPLLDIAREDVVYDAAWSPVRPGVFALVDGSGTVEVWDLNFDSEIPAARAAPSSHKASVLTKSLNKIAWEPHDGKRLAVGGLDGVITVFDVGTDLGGADDARPEEWANVKKLVARLDIGPSLDGADNRR
ncbi:MAG: hypothetical protein M1825_002327 [Sarcosagium campestre]|nr:MAG: hypothetical protein M1825_002327 [Sarcosagium campestre]